MQSKEFEMIFHEHNQSYSSYQDWVSLCPQKNGYTTQISKVFSGLLPEDFLRKTNCAVIMEKETSGSSIFVANFNRIDPNINGSQIDQNPYIVVFDHSGSKCTGGFIDHGTWENRTTTYLDTQLWNIVSGSGILDYLPIAEIPSKTSGNITELQFSSQRDAFETSFRALLKEN